MSYTNISKPTSSVYTKVNSFSIIFDDSNVTYDDSNIYYDGQNPASYTNISKPTSSVYTLIAKPT